MTGLESIKKLLMPEREEFEVEECMRDVKFERNIVDDCLDYWQKRRI